MPRSFCTLLKVLFSVLVFIPFVYAQSPAPTHSTSENPPVAAATPTTAVPSGKSFEEYFHQGTKSYQEKNYPLAVENFKKALEIQPESTTILTDLGLSYYQQKQRGLAIGYFRRA